MPFVSTALTAAESAAFANDKPLLLTPNRWLPSHTAQWRTAASFVSGSDGSDAAWPLARACDDFTHKLSRPSSALTSWNILFDFGAAGIEFDTVAILNHSLATATSSIGVSVSDVNNFTPATLLFLENSVSGRRFVRHLATRYSGVRYVRVLLTTGSPIQPTVGEIIFGKRVQFNWRPDAPYDDQELLTATVRRLTSIGGVTRTVRLSPIGQRRISALNLLDTESSQADALAWWKEHGGARPFLWSDNPLTAPHRACLMHQESPEISRPYTDALNREWLIEATEQGPHYAALEP